MTGPDRPREDPAGDQTQMLPPGSFGRAPSGPPVEQPEPPLLSGRSGSDPAPYGGSAPDPEGQTVQHTPFGGRADADQESTQYLSKTSSADSPWNPSAGSEQAPSSWDRSPADPAQSRWNQPAEQSPWSSGQPAASLPPTSPPPYAPEPPPYQPQYPGGSVVIEPRAVAVPVAGQQSRAAAGWVSMLVGLLVSVAGLFLFAHFGFAVDDAGVRSVGNAAVAALGVALLFGAAILNCWSGWATLVPGIVFAALGGLMFFDQYRTTWSWVDDAFDWALDLGTLYALGTAGLLMLVGLLLLGASIAAFVARRSGRREVTPVEPVR